MVNSFGSNIQTMVSFCCRPIHVLSAAKIHTLHRQIVLLQFYAEGSLVPLRKEQQSSRKKPKSCEKILQNDTFAGIMVKR